MTIEAKPYKEGKGWAIRFRYKGGDFYLSGFATSGAALSAANKKVTAIDKKGQPTWGGPKNLTVAAALQRYAAATLPFKKGAAQEARRINCFLRHAGMDEVIVTPTQLQPEQAELAAADAERPEETQKTRKAKKKRVYFDLTWQPAQKTRRIPGSLKAHRKSMSEESASSDAVRRRIARTRYVDMTTHLVQDFVDAFDIEGAAPATVHLEVSVLRQLFNYARRRWNWHEVESNPVSDADLPPVDNDRKRTMSEAEEARLLEALQRRRAKGIVELVGLALESAMRAEELVTLTWGEVFIDEWLIKLNDGKTGARHVPLSPQACELLSSMPRRGATEQVFSGMTYSKLAGAWRRSCKEADVKHLWFHDVRATAATRFANGAAKGNIFLVQALTGHKTLSMVQRYVRTKATDAAKVMRDAQAATRTPSGESDASGPEAGAADAHVATPIEPATASPDPVERPKGDAVEPNAGESSANAREALTDEMAQPGVDSDPENPPGETIVRVDFKARRRA